MAPLRVKSGYQSRLEVSRVPGGSAARRSYAFFDDAILQLTERAYTDIAEQTGRHPTLREVLGAVGGGAYPALVAGVLDELALPYIAQSGIGETRSYAVELHPLDSEWYYTEETAANIARLIPWDTPTLCLGAPTVAAVLARKHRPAVLVDKNPLVTRRLPELKAVKFINASVEDRRRIPNARAITFDAPWYAGDIRAWLTSAWCSATRGTVIYFSLFPQLVRPAAWRERRRLLTYAARIGEVSVDPGVLKYETPLFEQEALEAAHVSGTGDWRIGDLVRVRVLHDASWRRLSWPVRQHDPWSTYVVGTQVVKVRRRPTHARGPLLSSVAECPDDILPTVSARDPRRRSIGLWTSRNRVLSVRWPRLLRLLFAEMQAGVDLRTAAESVDPVGRYLDDVVVTKLASILR